MDTSLVLFGFMLLLIFVIAFLYASVGHGGASGYIAVLAIFGVATAQIKSSSLVLNILVSSIAFYHYYRAGYFKWSLFYPFALASIPFAYLGASILLSDNVYKKTLAVCLLFPIARLIWSKPANAVELQRPNMYVSLSIGAALGLVSGMLGIGGGILLSPILLILHWANMKQTAAVSSLFILVNSVAGFAALLQKQNPIDANILPLVGLAIAGGLAGAYLGSRKFQFVALKNILSLVLLIAAAKLFFT